MEPLFYFSLSYFFSFLSAATVNTVYVEPVSVERAHKCLGRIDLLVKIRRDVLVHPHIDERLELAKVRETPSFVCLSFSYCVCLCYSSFFFLCISFVFRFVLFCRLLSCLVFCFVFRAV